MADHRFVTARRCYTVALGAARHARRQISCVRKIVKLTSRKRGAIDRRIAEEEGRQESARGAGKRKKKKRKNEEKQSGAQIRNNETISIALPSAEVASNALSARGSKINLSRCLYLGDEIIYLSAQR